MKIGKQLYMQSRVEWRAWLEKNHADEKEIWLIHYKKHVHKPSVTYEEAVEEALCFGWIDGILKRIDDERHTIRYSPRRKRSIWSPSNKARVERLITQGLMTEAGLAKIREAKENGEWVRASVQEEPASTPPDLRAALASNKKAKHFFDQMAPSYRKQFIWWVTSAKRKETRQRRIRETVKLIAQNRRLGMQLLKPLLP